MRHTFAILLFVITVIAVASALSVGAQNRPGIQPEGPMISGHCLQVGSSSLRVQDVGAPCLTTINSQQPLSIGATVTGATPGMCLTVDINGKLAQTSCLTTQ